MGQQVINAVCELSCQATGTERPRPHVVEVSLGGSLHGCITKVHNTSGMQQVRCLLSGANRIGRHSKTGAQQEHGNEQPTTP
jgi:hypothetical protein